MRLRPILLVCVLLVAFSSRLWAQVQIAPPQQPPTDEQVIKAEKEQAKTRNKERHAALKRDTDKLLDLATELKRYVDQSNENVLSLNVVRKADEIEKLAHSVKTKMKGE